jgi:hypothetical protein
MESTGKKMHMSRRTLAKGIGGVAAAGVLARHADSSLAQRQSINSNR